MISPPFMILLLILAESEEQMSHYIVQKLNKIQSSCHILFHHWDFKPFVGVY
jgi:hypothetical protein